MHPFALIKSHVCVVQTDGEIGFYRIIHIPGVRDYIHVVDLALGHVAALKKLKENCGRKVDRHL